MYGTATLVAERRNTSFQSPRNLATVFLISISPLVLSACATVGPNYVQPDLEAASTEWIDQANVPVVEESFIAWWRDLGDPELTRLIETALKDNFSVRQAMSRLEEARARRSGTRSALAPAVSTDTSVNVIEQSVNASPGLDQFPGFERRFEQYNVGAGLSWEIDLWGQLGRRVEAANAQVGATVATANAVRLAVAIETASTYLSMEGHKAEADALEQSIISQREQVRLSNIRLDAGDISEAELVLVESELARLETQVPAIEAEIRAAALALGVLTGVLPEMEARLADDPSGTIPLKDVPVGLRADLLQRRPDIMRLERELAAQTAEIGVAQGELFPKLTLNAAGGFTSLSPDSLLNGDSRNFSILPFISWRIFDGGRVRAEIRLAEAEARTAALAYEEAVLTAIGEAETAIARYDLSRGALRRADRAVKLTQRNAALAQVQFAEGAIDRLRLQDALRTSYDAERNRASAYRNATLSLVQLYSALGGGWQPPETVFGSEQ